MQYLFSWSHRININFWWVKTTNKAYLGTAAFFNIICSCWIFDFFCLFDHCHFQSGWLALAINCLYHKMLFFSFFSSYLSIFSSENNTLLGSVSNFSNMFFASSSVFSLFSIFTSQRIWICAWFVNIIKVIISRGQIFNYFFHYFFFINPWYIKKNCFI